MRPLVVLIALAAALLALAAPAALAQSGADTVQQAIDAARASGQVDPATADAYTRDWRDARIAARRLRGAPKTHVAGVVRNTRSLGDRGMLADRLRPAMLIVQRNVEFFWRERQAAPAIGARRAFPGSDVIFQLYSGSGWQLQPLANLGRLNSLTRRARISDRTRRHADDLLALAVRRNGALAFEYLFPWSGGPPGWASAMPQAIALEVYARLGKTGEAREMLEVFRQDPPFGVRLTIAPGREHFLMYPQAPKLMIGNGFAQAILSLQAYTGLVDDPAAREVYDKALAEARAGMAAYDTGAWSLYYHEPNSPRGQESDLHYHRLFKDFLANLCQRVGGEPFCGLADRFARYETEPVTFGPARIAATRKVIEGRVDISKRSTMRVTLYRDDEVVRAFTLLGQRGTFRARFVRPRQAGEYRVRFDATALTGQRSSTEIVRELAAVKKRRPAATRR